MERSQKPINQEGKKSKTKNQIRIFLETASLLISFNLSVVALLFLPSFLSMSSSKLLKPHPAFVTTFGLTP